MTPEEQIIMAQHREYVSDLFQDGRIILSGTATDGTTGLLIYSVDTAIEARRLFYNDPAVIAGIGYPELSPFEIGHHTGS